MAGSDHGGKYGVGMLTFKPVTDSREATRPAVLIVARRVAGSQRNSRCRRLTGYLPAASDRPRLALYILDDIEPSTVHNLPLTNVAGVQHVVID